MALLDHAGAPRAVSQMYFEGAPGQEQLLALRCVCVRTGEILRCGGTPSPSRLSDPSPCAAPLIPHHFSTHTAPALLAAVCPRVLVTAIDPVRIAFCFIPSDTGCGHNKTHLIMEMLRVSWKGKWIPPSGGLEEAARMFWGVQKPLQHLGVMGAATEGLTPPSSSNGTDGSRSLSISESWQTN